MLATARSPRAACSAPTAEARAERPGRLPRPPPERARIREPEEVAGLGEADRRIGEVGAGELLTDALDERAVGEPRVAEPALQRARAEAEPLRGGGERRDAAPQRGGDGSHDAGIERVGRDGEVREPVLRIPLEDGAELGLGPRDRQVERGPSYETVEGTRRDVSEVDPTMAGAAGGDAWITTTRDTATFLAALWAGRPFARPESTRAATLGFVDAILPEDAQTGYGLGLARFHFGGRDYVGHLGGTAGSQSFMLVDTTSGAVLTGAMTTRGDLGAFLVPVLEAMGSVR